MTTDEIRAKVLEALSRIAPEIDVVTLAGNVPLRRQVDIDSMDFLRFVIELDQTLHVAVPETDYGELSTIDRCVGYLADRLSASPAA